MDVEGIILSEISQTEKGKHLTVSLTYGILKTHTDTTKLIDTEDRLLVARVAGAAGRDGEEMGEDGQKVQTSRYKINKSWNVMNSMVTIVNNTVLHI